MDADNAELDAVLNHQHNFALSRLWAWVMPSSVILELRVHRSMPQESLHADGLQVSLLADSNICTGMPSARFLEQVFRTLCSFMHGMCTSLGLAEDQPEHSCKLIVGLSIDCRTCSQSKPHSSHNRQGLPNDEAPVQCCCQAHGVVWP